MPDAPSANRIDARFQQLRANGQRAFVAYICAGDPTLDRTMDIVLALEKAGADIIELGLPFSDPLADGVVNVYTYRQPSLINPLFEAVTAKTGIQVRAVFAENGLNIRHELLCW